MKKIISLLLLVSLTVTGNMTGIVSHAEDVTTVVEVQEEINEGEIIEEQDQIDSSANDETVESSEQESPIVGEKGLINYVYIESPYLEAPSVQKIVVSYGDGTDIIENVSLIYENEEAIETELPMSKCEKNVYLFEKQFSESEQGIYHVKSIRFVENGEIKTIEFDAIGIEALFGINEYYPGYGEEEIAAVSETSESEAVAVALVDVDDPGNVQEVVEETLEDCEVQPLSKARASEQKYVIVLDPGHGGSDPGASGNGVSENVINYKIATYCKQELEQYGGVTVYLTRTENENPSIYERVQIAKNYGANLLVSLHNNASDNAGAHGAEVLCPNANYNKQMYEEGYELSNKILNELELLGITRRSIVLRNSDGGKYPDGSTSDYYGICRYSKLAGFTGIIVEHAFVTNANDVDKFLSSDAKLKELGIADAKGIASFLELSKGEWKSDAKGIWFEYSDGSRPINTWKKIAGYWYYFDSNGYRKTGWLKDGSETYYLESDGKMVIGWKTINNAKYYFKSSGAMHTGWLTENSHKYYFNTDGKLATGTFNVGNTAYHTDSSGAIIIGSGWKLIDDDWYYFYSSGQLHIGWLKSGGKWYYLNSDGKMATGFVKVGGKTYYLSSTGAMLTGWQKISNIWYYFESSGAMRTGWLKSGGKWYYLNSDGKMATGFVSVSGKTYYLSSTGAMLTGWQKISNIWYYFDSSGAMQTGWLKSGGKWYYLNADGKMATGWITDNGKKYYLNANGSMVTGTVTIDGKVYKFSNSGDLISDSNSTNESGSSGSQKTGWQFTDGKWYYYGSNGNKKTGWLKDGEYWYYLDTNGVMMTGWVEESAQKYYLNPETNSFGPKGSMAVGWRNIGGTYYYFNKDVSPVGALYYTGVTDIMGVSRLGLDKQSVVDKMVKMYQKSGRTYPSGELSKGQAADITAFCNIVYEEAVAENVKPEVVFGQAMKETGYLQFGGDVKITQFNFAGLGATGNGVQGEVFSDVRTGIRAQVQHLKAYASTLSLNNSCEDKRFNYVKRGTAPYVEWLGIQENPAPNCGWAASRHYGFSLMRDYIEPMYSL